MSIFDRFEMENENVENVDAFHTNEQKNTKKKGKRGFSTNPYCARKRHSRQNGQKNHQMSRMSRTPFPSLPSDCPFETGGFCPPGCRYTTKFLVMMIKRGMLPDPNPSFRFEALFWPILLNFWGCVVYNLLIL